jgi:hypothetical protein
MKPWPRLSETLPGPKAPDRCRSCGSCGDLATWQEHDDADRPEGVYLVLCTPCSDRIIEPHPRLYAQVDPNRPLPGVMALCIDCRHRDGIRCGHPGSLANGGPGIAITVPRPFTAHICARGRGSKGLSGWRTSYPGPPRSCSGHEAAAAAAAGSEAIG